MAADPDAPVAIDGQSVTGDPDVPVHVGENVQQAGADPDAPVAIDGVSADGQKKGFWAEFGGATGGVKGLLKAPFTDSIPAEMIKAPFSSDENKQAFARGLPAGGLMGGYAMMIKQKIDNFLATPESQDIPKLAKQAYRDTVTAVHEHPGAAAGSVVKGIVADPELFFLPGLTEAHGVEAGAAAARAAGAGEKVAAIAGKVSGKATAAGTGGAIGATAEVSHELGEDEPFNPGGIAVSAGIGALAGAATQIKARDVKVRPMTPEEIDAQIAPAMATDGGTPEVHVEPSHDGYVVRAQDQGAQITYPTKAEADAAAAKIRDTASAYRTMDTVPRGTPNAEGARASMMFDNPFTAENMAKWVKRAGASAEQSGDSLLKFWTKAAVSAGIGAGLGSWLDPDDPKMAAGFGAAITLVPRGLPRDRRISIEKVINERNGMIAVFARHTLQFKSAIDAEVPESLRRNAISLALEGHPGIELNAAEKGVARSVRTFFNTMGETAVDAGVLKEMLHNYVSHIVVEDPAAKAAGTIDKLVDILTGKNTRPTDASGRQFAKHRRYATFDQLQTALRGSGLKIKTGDIGEIMAIYSKAMFRAVTDKRLLTALKEHPVDEMPPMVIRAQNYARAMGNRLLGREPHEGEFREADPKLAAPSGGYEFRETEPQARHANSGDNSGPQIPHTIEVWKDGKKVGDMSTEGLHPNQKAPIVGDMWVDEAHRRKGLATEMFRRLKEHHPTLNFKGSALTEDGEAFANSAPGDRLPAKAFGVAETGGGTGSPGEPPAGGGFELPPDPGPGEAAQRYAARGPQTLVMPSNGSDSNYVQSTNRQLAGYMVHKDIAPQLNFVFSARDPNDVTLGLMALNQASKRAIVSFSLFHAKSLTDAFIGDQGLKALANPKARVQDALAMFRYGGDNGGIDHLLKGGLQLQAQEDAAHGAMEGALARTAELLDKVLPVSGIGRKGAEAATKLAKFNDKLDHFTFRTLQTGFKLITGLDAYERLIKKGLPPERAGEMAASYANDIYGSLDWFRVASDVHSKVGRDAVYGFFNPNGRRIAQLLMFAPDWTFSTFRAAYKALPGAVDDPALASLHRRYLMKSALYYLTVANGINFALSGHSVFDNENPTRIALKDGRTMQFSKHFMEPFEWLRDPMQTLANKLAFMPREAVQQMTGKEYISAHDTAPDIENRAAHVANQFLPINAQQGLAGGNAASMLGLVGMPIYGKDPEQKIEAKKKKREAAIEKKKKQAEYFKRVHKND